MSPCRLVSLEVGTNRRMTYLESSASVRIATPGSCIKNNNRTNKQQKRTHTQSQQHLLRVLDSLKAAEMSLVSPAGADSDHVCPRFSSRSFSPLRLAAIRFPGRCLTGRAAPRAQQQPQPQQPPPPPPSAARPTTTGSWRAAARSSTLRWGCTAPRTPPRPLPATTTPTTSPTAPSRRPSTPLWWASRHPACCLGITLCVFESHF